uniref:Phage integrase family protein n=2 Tax=Rhizobium rhizogenes TaxID=359 RepID=A0A7S5DRV2_RHIRH|nr:phage integrase family protein [Rhizobium rhizogenes]
MDNTLLTPKVSGPLEQFETDFIERITSSGYSRSQIRTLKRLFSEFDRWLAVSDLQAGDLHVADVDHFLADRVTAGQKVSISKRAMEPLLDYLCSHGITFHEHYQLSSGSLAQILDGFQRYLTEERGVTGPVARQYRSQICSFIETHVSASKNGTGSLKGLAESDVIAFVVAKCPRMTRAGAALFVTALRSLLRFLHLAGYIDRPMTSSVPSVPGRRLTGLPKRIEPDVLEQLLTSCDRSTRIGSRCFAVLTMLSRLGLRAGEVANLRLDDINWRSGEIVIARAKGNRTEALPLPADVGEALADYITLWRPSNAVGRTAFVRVQAPHGALTRGAVTQMVAHAAERCGLGRIHAHRLRHTAATNMLRNGASLTEVGQVLRHRQMLTTTIYAKADREALRSIARIWPGDIV